MQAKSTYSRIGAPKKKPSVSSVGVRGETRWKSRMPETLARADGRADLRGPHHDQDDALENQQHIRTRPRSQERVELIARPGDAHAEHEHDHDRRAQRLPAQPRPDVLDEDRIVEPVTEPVPVHHDSSLDPTLRKSSSRLSLRRTNEATRTPCATRVAKSSLAASASPWNRNS